MKKHLKTVVVLLLVVALSARAAWYWRELRRDREIADWLRTHAIRLATVDPMSDLADMKPLAPVIGDARIVGAGEATHGTREHFLYKHRLLRFLVTQKGFRALAFESPWPTGLALNEYVLGGDGDPARLLGQAVFGVWHTQEVLDTIRWMREYNATVRPEQRVEFAGIDMQLTRGSARAVAQYLDRVDRQFRAHHASTLDLLAAKEMEGLYLEFVDYESRPRNTAGTRTISAVVREVLAHFDAQRERYIAASSASEFDVARQHANILAQQAAKCEDRSGAARDRSMADNLDWYMARRPGVKVMIWAHNGHVQITRDPNSPAPLGRHLKDRHGKAYVSVGFVLGSGSYRALDARKTTVGRHPRFATFTFGRPPARTLNALMAATGNDIFAVDLRSARGRIREILERPLRIRQGAGIVMGRDPLGTIKRSLPATHDVLIFIDRTTPARPIQGNAIVIKQ